jgi:hypothetical protein
VEQSRTRRPQHNHLHGHRVQHHGRRYVVHYRECRRPYVCSSTSSIDPDVEK